MKNTKNITFLIVMIGFMIHTITASHETDGKFLKPRVKKEFKSSSLFAPIHQNNNQNQYPDRSSIFEPDDALEINDIKTDTMLEESGTVYLSKSMFSYFTGTFKQRDSRLSSIQNAIMNNDKKRLTTLLEGQDLSTITKFDDNPLVTAILFDREHMISPLLKAGANPSTKDKDGDDVIYLAYKESSRARIVEKLLKAERNQSILSGKITPTKRTDTASVSPYFFPHDSDSE